MKLDIDLDSFWIIEIGKIAYNNVYNSASLSEFCLRDKI